MKAAIYNPYLDTLGGGERYTITIANVLAKKGYEVDLSWKDIGILHKISERFGLKIHRNIKIVPDIKRGEGYNLCFWVSDGSIPTLKAQRNFIHFQVPFKNVNGRSLLNKMKFFRVEKVLVNSKFTKKVIDDEFGINSEVLYPPVDINLFKRKKKENLILYVGRFSELTQSKHQEVLVNSFKELVGKDPNFKDWKLVLAGGVEVGAGKFLDELQKLAEGYNIVIVKSPTIDTLKDLYGNAKLFWSAAGYNEDEVENPAKFEHFGITVVEAMSAGCIPIVYNGGGHREIIDNAVSGYLWDNIQDLLTVTQNVVNKILGTTIASKSLSEKVNTFSSEVFEKQVLGLV